MGLMGKVAPSSRRLALAQLGGHIRGDSGVAKIIAAALRDLSAVV